MNDIKKCSCGEAKYCDYYVLWYISVTFNGGSEVDHYPVEYCPKCGKKLNADGTTGKPYAELEAELAEAKRRAAWYLAVFYNDCVWCVNSAVAPIEEPCKSCYKKKNFSLAPVPEDFEVKENE